MKFKLTYQIGKQIVQEWTLNSRTLAYWYKSELLFTNNYNLGKFKITPL